MELTIDSHSKYSHSRDKSQHEENQQEGAWMRGEKSLAGRGLVSPLPERGLLLLNENDGCCLSQGYENIHTSFSHKKKSFIYGSTHFGNEEAETGRSSVTCRDHTGVCLSAGLVTDLCLQGSFLRESG